MMTLRFVLSSITEEAVGDSPLTNMAFSLSYISLLKYEFVYIFLLNDIEVGSLLLASMLSLTIVHHFLKNALP